MNSYHASFLKKCFPTNKRYLVVKRMRQLAMCMTEISTLLLRLGGKRANYWATGDHFLIKLLQLNYLLNYQFHFAVGGRIQPKLKFAQNCVFGDTIDLLYTR